MFNFYYGSRSDRGRNVQSETENDRDKERKFDMDKKRERERKRENLPNLENRDRDNSRETRKESFQTEI